MTLFKQERGSDRRVHTAGESDQHAHRTSLAERQRRRLLAHAAAPRLSGRLRALSRCQRLWSRGRGRAGRGAWPPRGSTPSRAGRGSARLHRSRMPIPPKRRLRARRGPPAAPRPRLRRRPGCRSRRSGRARATASWTPGTVPVRPSTRRSASARTRAVALSRSRTAARAAAAMATTPATFWVPARRSRSCGPPRRIGRSAAARVRARATSAPTPFGPPNLWALTLTRSTPDVRPATSSQPNACTASVCTSAAGARSRTSATTSSSGWRTPVSLLTSITDTRRTLSSSDIGEHVEVDDAATVDGDRPAAGRKAGLEHRWVLHRAAQDRPGARRHAGDGEVVGLGAAAREDDLTGARSEQAGELLTGVVEGPQGGSGEGVAPGRVAVAVREEREHRRDGLGAHRCGGGVIEVGDRAALGAGQPVGAPGGNPHASRHVRRRRVARDARRAQRVGSLRPGLLRLRAWPSSHSAARARDRRSPPSPAPPSAPRRPGRRTGRGGWRRSSARNHLVPVSML